MKRVPSKVIWKEFGSKFLLGKWLGCGQFEKKIGWAIFKFQKGRWAKISDFDAEKTMTKMFMASDFVQ